MALIPYTAFKKLVLTRIWPDTADLPVQGPENVQAALEAFVQSGLAAVYQYNDCLNTDQFSVFPQCATYFRCGVSVVGDAPPGVLKDVRVVGDAPCQDFLYRQTSPEELRAWSSMLQRRMVASNPSQTASDPIAQLPFGFEYPSASTDSVFGRALTGIWALDGSRLLVAPWVQSDERIIVRWAGSKNTWMPDDLVPDDLLEAVTLFVQMGYNRDFACNMERKEMYGQEFNTANAELLWDCRQRTQVRVNPEAEAPEVGQAAWAAFRTGDTRAPAAPPAVVPVVVGFIADYGDEIAHPGPPRDVAELVKGWNPVAIITGGDNNYPAGSASTIDGNIGALYRSFIKPFTGTAPLWDGEVDAAVNRFWPALGNHDWDGLLGSSSLPFQQYFPALPSGTQPGQWRFYDVVIGPMHFFVLNGGLNTAGTVLEPAGIGELSTQASWLEQRVAQSTAPFKIAVVHNAPFCSDSLHGPGEPVWRWPFKALGLSLVLSGHAHNYERLEVGAFPYVVCGTGGAPLRPFGTVVAGSLVRNSTDFGALRLTATCAELSVEFISVSGTVLDTLTL